jgi:hypothetical protein
MVGALLAFLGLFSASYIGQCFQSGDAIYVECRYDQQTAQPSDDEVLALIGRDWMLGPWSNVSTDLVQPLVIAAAGKRTIVINAHMGGDAFLTIAPDAEGSLVAHSTFDPLSKEAGAFMIAK